MTNKKNIELLNTMNESQQPKQKSIIVINSCKMPCKVPFSAKSKKAGTIKTSSNIDFIPPALKIQKKSSDKNGK